MTQVVALAVEQGPGFVDLLRREWGHGHAVAVLAPGLPDAERERVLAAVRPTHVVDDAGKRLRPGGVEAEAGDALVMTTSGSTGEPRAVVLTHRAVEASARLTSDALAIDPGSDRWLCCLPVWHIGGMSVITRSLATGTALTVHPRFDAAAVTAAASDGVTRVSLVTRALAAVDPALFATVLLGGAAPPPERPPNVIATYGSTETGSGVVYDGRPLDGVELRIDQGGQLWVRSPTLLRCYRDGSDPTTADGWYPTGDAGAIDEAGMLHVHGRLDDAILTGGEKVWPARLERRLGELGGVAAVAVVGRPDPEWGHEVVALIEVDRAATPPSIEEVKAHVRAVLPAHYAPRAVVPVDELPRTPFGKIRRSALASMVAGSAPDRSAGDRPDASRTPGPATD